MKKLLFLLTISPVFCFAGELWQWAPGHYIYTGRNGYQSEGWQWAPGHTTWTDNRGHRREVWEWAPGYYQIDEN